MKRATASSTTRWVLARPGSALYGRVYARQFRSTILVHLFFRQVNDATFEIPNFSPTIKSIVWENWALDKVRRLHSEVRRNHALRSRRCYGHLVVRRQFFSPRRARHQSFLFGPRRRRTKSKMQKFFMLFFILFIYFFLGGGGGGGAVGVSRWWLVGAFLELLETYWLWCFSPLTGTKDTAIMTIWPNLEALLIHIFVPMVAVVTRFHCNSFGVT